MSDKNVRLALTIGDPGGIGPEITAALLASGALAGADVFVIGAFSALSGRLPLRERGAARVIPCGEAAALWPAGAFPVFIDTGAAAAYEMGRPTAEGGRASGLAIETAAALAKRGLVEGIVTGPVSKHALALAGFRQASHTAMLASLFGASDCQMMMVSGSFRVVILTRDIPLREVPGAVTMERIETGARVTAEALRELWNIEHARIAVAALNPHAGDGGVLGDEEGCVVAPAIAALRKEGYLVEGPFSADSLFYKWADKGYDAAIALYHDQGMIPFKMAGFERGVNVTIGLPIVRTSVCHGTAYDIVGTGSASPASLESAFSLAVECCIARRRWRSARKV
ncbi:MAG: 4-hydroxythreonine-4-phosphate dehydrogenase PdxA [Candidatus Krumholzibacteria bacterium]|nr:4-hydroxythreonine-4-phosphate dehydrogenase PdxA [Candidatus Krumholzibacteria bacterium]